MNMDLKYISYLLQFADNSLILGQRISEWTGHGPVLEQDIAMTNIALDHIGQARAFYQYAAEKLNQISIEEQKSYFKSPSIVENLGKLDEDDLAFLRDAWDFKNLLLVEQPNGDMAYTITRSFFYDHFIVLAFEYILEHSKDLQLKAIAEKSIKESKYHRRWSSEWMIRLGDGTELSKAKMQKALEDILPYVGEMFKTSKIENDLHGNENLLDLKKIEKQWMQNIKEVLDEATLSLPEEMPWMQDGGKNGVHTEHLGYILAEMQFMQRAYPNMEW